jgi:hypothetical protein
MISKDPNMKYVDIELLANQVTKAAVRGINWKWFVNLK